MDRFDVLGRWRVAADLWRTERVPWRVTNPAEALENLVAADLWPWEGGAVEWVCPCTDRIWTERLPSCATCGGAYGGALPWNLEALVAVARYGADRLREIAAVAEESGVRLRWTLRNRTAHDVPGPSASRGARQLAAWGVEVIATETHRGAFGGPVWWRVAVPALPRGVRKAKVSP